MKNSYPFWMSIGVLAVGSIVTVRVVAQQPSARTGASPGTPTQSQSPAARIAAEARAAGIELRGDSSFTPVTEGDFDDVRKKMSGAKSSVMKRQMDLLNERYDLGHDKGSSHGASRS